MIWVWFLQVAGPKAQVQSSLSNAPLCKSTAKHPKSALGKVLVSKDRLVRAPLGLGRRQLRRVLCAAFGVLL